MEGRELAKWRMKKIELFWKRIGKVRRAHWLEKALEPIHDLGQSISYEYSRFPTPERIKHSHSKEKLSISQVALRNFLVHNGATAESTYLQFGTSTYINFSRMLSEFARTGTGHFNKVREVDKLKGLKSIIDICRFVVLTRSNPESLRKAALDVCVFMREVDYDRFEAGEIQTAKDLRALLDVFEKELRAFIWATPGILRLMGHKV